MNIDHSLLTIATAALLLGAQASGAETSVRDIDHPVYRAQAATALRNAPLNRARVAADLQAAGLSDAPVTWYAVPAMSDVRRMPDTYPQDGRARGELRVVAARTEFEPASFQLYSLESRQGVELSVSDLKTENGEVLPAKQVDLKVVKVWFQNGNAWISYFQDVGLALVPELLVHDENLIKVDLEQVANYARLKDAAGERHVWISQPAELDPGGHKPVFDPLRSPFADASELQPFALDAGAFKQFFATVHVPADQPAGVYRGAVAATQGGKRLVEIPLAVRVLPFELPRPRTSFDLDRDFIVSVMGGIRLAGWERGLETLLGGDPALARTVYRSYLANQRDHGIFQPLTDQNAENFALLKELGLPGRPILKAERFIPWFGLNFGGRMRFDQMMTAKRGARRCADFYQAQLGHNDVYVIYGDEQNAAFVAAHRGFFAYFQEHGIKVGSAGHEALLYKGGYAWDMYSMGGDPDSAESIRPWNDIGAKTVGFYACQHTGSENPQFVRRQHGLVGYFNNLGHVFNYEFAIGPWNDRATPLYKPMALAYLNRGGIVDTLQWEGFREGIDDMRYATQLKLLARDAVASGDVHRAIEAKKALQYLALLKPSEMDLNVVRAEMTARILNLLSME